MDERPVLDPSYCRPGGYGLVPRDYDTHPKGCFAFAPEEYPDDLLVPESDIDGLLQELIGKKDDLLSLREAKFSVLQSLDQNGFGLCWAFSSTKAMMYLRAIQNEPDEILSAWYVAGKVKGWRDQGGFGGESLNFIAKSGVPAMSFCPDYHSRNDTPECEANAKLHVAGSWWECSEDPQKAFHQACSAYIRFMVPTIQDFDWLSHSMCVPSFHAYKSPHSSADNSWGNQGDKGLYDLKGKHALPNGCWIPRVIRPAAA